MKLQFDSFAEFYPYYLAQHGNRVCRLLHLAGVLLGAPCLVYAILGGSWPSLGLAALFGYGFGWTGHFVFERNKPAAFGHPFYSFIADFRMAAETLRNELAGRRTGDGQHVDGQKA